MYFNDFAPIQRCIERSKHTSTQTFLLYTHTVWTKKYLYPTQLLDSEVYSTHRSLPFCFSRVFRSPIFLSLFFDTTMSVLHQSLTGLMFTKTALFSVVLLVHTLHHSDYVCAAMLVGAQPDQHCNNVTKPCPSSLLYETTHRSLIPSGYRCMKTSGPSCILGTACVGPDANSTCEKPMQIGEGCGRDPYSVCDSSSGLICDTTGYVCKRLAKLGSDCSADNVKCEDHSFCSKSTIAMGQKVKICARVQNKPGTSCSKDGSVECDHGKGLLCDTTIGKCVLDEGSMCADDSAAYCEKGLSCVGPPNKRECHSPADVGQPCDWKRDSFNACSTERADRPLQCQGKRCRIQAGGNCNKAEAFCGKGTVCATSRLGQEQKRCTKPRRLRQTCDGEYEKCQSNLSCDTIVSGEDGAKVMQKICLRKWHTKCSAKGECQSGTDCLPIPWKPSLKRCFKTSKIGGRCNGKTVLCKGEHTTCDNSVCKRSSGGPCMTSHICAFGLHCVGPRDGNDSLRRCHALIDAGGRCLVDNPYSVCKYGMQCENEECRVPIEGACDPAWIIKPSDTQYRRRCVSGARCVRASTAVLAESGHRRHDYVCYKALAAGMKCKRRNGFDACDRGLRCQHGVCRVVIGGGCETLTANVGNNNNSNDGGTSQRLQRKVLPCMADLSCIDGHCKHKAEFLDTCEPGTLFSCGIGLACDAPTFACKRTTGERCNSGLECVHGTDCAVVQHGETDDIKLCAPVREYGEKCGVQWNALEETSVCGRGLVCFKGKCERLTNLPLWAPCGQLGAKCLQGLVCMGRKGRQYCARNRSYGERCSRSNPFLRCGDGLTCAVDNVCVELSES